MGRVSIAANGIPQRTIPTARLHLRLRRVSSGWRLALRELHCLTLDLMQRDTPLDARTRRYLEQWADLLTNDWLKALAQRAVAFDTLVRGGAPTLEDLRALRWHAASVEFQRALRRGEDPERASRRYRRAAVSGLRLVRSGARPR